MMVLKAKVKMHQRCGKVMCLVYGEGQHRKDVGERRYVRVFRVGPS
jgi:hypothetical protein